MTKKNSLATSLSILSTTTLLVLISAGGSAAAPAETPPDVSNITFTRVADPDYWTSERMRSALPGDELANQAMKKHLVRGPGTETSVESGVENRIEGSEPAVSHLTKASESPIKHIGKVFFTLGGSNYVCSGNSVIAANRSTVSTAGHCLNEGPYAYATNFVFVPAYFNGTAPYGKWTAKALYTPSRWASNGDMQYDTGFAVVNSINGQKLADVVGSSGIRFNAARGLNYKAFGYPAGSPFNGESLKSCSGKATNDPYNPWFISQGIRCNMTGGSSGGPWFTGTSSTGYQNSVNSYGYGSNSTTMYGPYWGAVIQDTYNSASQG